MPPYWGHAFGPNPERGVYRTRNGGRTWEQILKKDADTGASDVALDPSNPSILFAGFWQARRTPLGARQRRSWAAACMYRVTAETPGSSFLVGGLPEGIWGKVGVAVAPSDGRQCLCADRSRERQPVPFR